VRNKLSDGNIQCTVCSDKHNYGGNNKMKGQRESFMHFNNNNSIIIADEVPLKAGRWEGDINSTS
jgi:hypothetical protein